MQMTGTSVVTDEATTGTEPTSSPLDVTVVIPCYNEEEACPSFFQMLRDLRAQLAHKYTFTFLVVDDGSTDGTFEALKAAFDGKNFCRVVRHDENRGVAAAIMTGIRRSQTEVVCSMDFDGSYEPAQLATMIPLLSKEIDVVTGSPYHPDGRVRNVPRWRLALSKSASVLYSFFLKNQLHCYTSCFRVYRRSSVAGIDLKNSGFVGVVELLWELDRRGGTIIECPTVLGVREYGQSKMRTFEVMMGHFKLMLRTVVGR